MLNKLKKDMKKVARKNRAITNARFFKTGKGEYGEGDLFLGLTVPESRKISKKYKDLQLKELTTLLKSKYHEERLVALLILVQNYAENKEKIFNFYLKNTKYVNNWDLVDLTADKIVGEHLLTRKKDILYKLAKSENLWEKRISIISTFQFIKNNKFTDTLKISELLLNDSHDLIHKAVGWMLREVGKRNQSVEEKFLKKHHQKIPRTTLRYAIEKFPENKKKFYMNL